MYKLLEYSLDYSDTAGSFFYAKDEAIHFNGNVSEDNAFKIFKFKAKLLENGKADGANWILTNIDIAVPLQYLSNFWRSLEMSLD